MAARPDAALEKSVPASGFPFPHGPFGVGRLRGAGGFDQPLSPAAGMEMPLGWPPALDVTVDVDELDDVDDTDDDEFVRWSVFRGMNMLFLVTSDGVIFTWPPLIHPGLLRFAKLGGFATAVMGKTRGEMSEALDGRG